ncbi:MAG: threonine-phosphate decarboxylase [Rhodopseudomonas sp.]|uniref:threonine-phosphate decarboxylase CobD n=1 Tax=Rhodopseudomonas sp. TaxID=1078 RepID=UPI0017F31051|nr:threonine-phosphate decarboxylase CobD [Rhodopseudomonas sp.]NVN85986.1 threonine-phosphate decarboxylase [Rhodopseudomonas sp.]
MKHGGDLTEAMARHGGAPRMWLDLSTGINPWSWPIPELPAEVWRILPSRADEFALINAARAAYRVPAGVAIVAASGTQALIQWLPHLAAAGAVAVIGPTYNEHAAAWRNAGREVIAISSLDGIPDGVRHAVIVNPNNPDGRVAARDSLARAAAMLQARGGWLVIDEAFADVDPTIGAAALCPDLPIVILRSFGKFYGLAGVRLGFAIAAPDIASRIEAAIGPWACSGPALLIGAAALRDSDWADGMRDALRRQAARLDVVLRASGCEIVGGTSLFRLVRRHDARAMHDALAHRQIWCRRFDWADDLLRFGLPPDDAALARLAAALG